MPIALSEEHRDLAASAAGWAARHAPIAETRAEPGRPELWKALTGQGWHSLHLPESVGGQGGGLLELAVVAEQFGRHLVPGPFLPTVMASAVLAAAEPTEALAAFAAGATGAVVLEGLTASSTADGWQVNGTSCPALGLADAELAVVRAQEIWLVLRPEPGQLIPVEAVDLTRSAARLKLENFLVSQDNVVEIDPERAELALAVPAAAEAAGLCSWTLDCAVDHVRTRVQFGRPIGSFQAVQHQAAGILLHREIATAAAWDAARAERHSVAQQALAAAQARHAALPAAVDASVSCVRLLGAIGFTWEHDAHLYWRRAVALSGSLGRSAARTLGERARTTTRDLTLASPDDCLELRRQIASVLDQTEPSAQALADAGLAAPHYPKPYGLDAGPLEQAVIAEEFERRGIPQPTTVIGEWVLPTLLVHGSAEQRERFVMPTLRGEIRWCQLFSEPGAGSDLASLTTRAAKVDGGWRISGQKVWTSLAHEAHWGVCLARTDPDAPRHRGISYFLVDLAAEGVTVRPIKQATGRAEFNEVFLDDVFVPDRDLVGEPNSGWRLATTTLANERHNMGATLAHGSSDRIRQLLRDRPDDPDALAALGRCASRELTLATLGLRGVLARLAGTDLGAEVSVQKVFSALAQQEGSREVIALLGPGSASAEGGHVLDHLGLPAVLFGGGTVEIQLNVIAHRVLGLPR
ncbi:acyl-CoA dehydrogenase [Amycolatopsis sp. Poz14]|uniref:acyl-CoA dehydrogenase n=1 Tax=Amycolatopsis sp. Poz14 TaxID=1447705 RepID=UPI001EE9A136|nr:acyl-CoA dehydrogenase [Amycolatopsis sp. Poz14]MCG3753004.1 acyl-CoA dehydrogenase [Amycolatopsis sp. Poz14]